MAVQTATAGFSIAMAGHPLLLPAGRGFPSGDFRQVSLSPFPRLVPIARRYEFASSGRLPARHALRPAPRRLDHDPFAASRQAWGSALLRNGPRPFAYTQILAKIHPWEQPNTAMRRFHGSCARATQVIRMALCRKRGGGAQPMRCRRHDSNQGGQHG